MKDLAIGIEDFDIVIEKGDFKTSNSITESVLIALTTSKDWWVNNYTRNRIGGDLKEYIDAGMLEPESQSVIKDYIEKSLEFLNLDKLEVLVSISEGVVNIVVDFYENDEKKKVELSW